MAATINNTYNIDTDKDIDPFAGTNLDAQSTNTRGNTSEESYNTYKNTVYTYKTVDSTTGWFPEETVTGSGYPATQRNQMEIAANIKIFQKEGIGSSVNTPPTTGAVSVHTPRTKETNLETYDSSDIAEANLNKGEKGDFDTNMNLLITDFSTEREKGKLESTDYTPNATVAATKLNKGEAGAFDTNMNSVTNSANQMSYRNYTEDTQNDNFTEISNEITDESEITGTIDATTNAIDITLGGAIIEAGNHFNRGNDTTTKEIKDDPDNPGSKVTTGIDVNSSRVLDMSMYLNSFKSDILELRGGAGIDVTGKYPTQQDGTE